MNIEELIKRQLHINDHPLVKTKLTMLRDKNTGPKDFRELVNEIATLICYEATSDIKIEPKQVETPIGIADGFNCVQSFGIVPILRAGLGMVQGIANLLPTAKIGHIGMYRGSETQRVEYYCKLPPQMEEREILLIDPMLATGRTAEQSINCLKKAGAKRIKFLCIVAVREGVVEVLSKHPDVAIYAAVCDEKLTDHDYIYPGLGDAGDRLFGTK